MARTRKWDVRTDRRTDVRGGQGSTSCPSAILRIGGGIIIILQGICTSKLQKPCAVCDPYQIIQIWFRIFPFDPYSILFYPITLEGRRGTTDEFATIPFHLDLFSAALVELAKSIPVHSLILSSHLFFCLPLFLFPFTVPCRIVFAKPEDLETWPNHLSFRFLTRVRSSSYSPMAAWIFLRTSSLVTWSLYEMFNSLR